jgi:hypothetical protein
MDGSSSSGRSKEFEAAWLKPTATTSERVRGLLAVGLTRSDIVKATGVAERTFSNWKSGRSNPHADVASSFDDLRFVAMILIEGGVFPERVGRWLLSRNSQYLDGQRPVDLIQSSPQAVISAAQAEVPDTAPRIK